MERHITGTHFYNYSQCPHRVYLDAFGDKNLMGKEPEFLQLLWDMGVQHEKEIIKGKDYAEVDLKDPEEAFARTIDFMTRGLNLIYQGVLIDGRKMGRPDLLERHEGRSKFGDYYYIPIDIKSGTGYEDKEKETPKKNYGLQLSFYADLLNSLQGFKPETGKIINIEGEEIIYNLSIFEEEYKSILLDLTMILSGNVSYEPCLGSVCNLCHWQSYCEGWAREQMDSSNIFYLGWEKKYEMKKRGIHTVQDVALIDVPIFLKEKKIKGVGEKMLKKFKERAEVIINKKEALHNRFDFPLRETELFFDIEDDPTRGIYYLFGILKRRRKEVLYTPFLAESPEEEGNAWRGFWDYIKSERDFIIYYYSSHEKTVLNTMRKRYWVEDDLFNCFFENSIDLYTKVILPNTDWPFHSYSIKRISKYLGFRYSVQDASGAKSIYWYSEFLKDPIANRRYMDMIVKYNREDCEATMLVKDWLAGEFDAMG